MGPIDYSKWDQLESSDDEDAESNFFRKAAAAAETKRLREQQMGRPPMPSLGSSASATSPAELPCAEPKGAPPKPTEAPAKDAEPKEAPSKPTEAPPTDAAPKGAAGQSGSTVQETINYSKWDQLSSSDDEEAAVSRTVGGAEALSTTAGVAAVSMTAGAAAVSDTARAEAARELCAHLAATHPDEGFLVHPALRFEQEGGEVSVARACTPRTCIIHVHISSCASTCISCVHPVSHVRGVCTGERARVVGPRGR